MSRCRSPLLAALLLVFAAGCDGGEETVAVPPPEEYGGEAVGYFCNMLLAEHSGPKGQVHLSSRATPLWFSSVRDTVAFTLLEGEPKNVAAIYVNDMGAATDWTEPEPGTWVMLKEAWLVIGSRHMGGMGLPEVVPFGTSEAARDFAAEYGGRVVRLAEVPADYVLGSPQLPQGEGSSHDAH
ncbi:nitrous oxide reductase accessory protein NosL [Pelagibius sp. CAU 1746]|uniref:nitrous oxide reductase accessory protein NosL n=1 Tax=Pelagibius sp. CAU 1746 TaxID=3140370 RepID=UPI00325BC86B